MVVFRCTQRLAKRFALELAEDSPASTGTLGDWYANLLNIGHTRLVLCLSERTLLPVLLPARKAEFPGRFSAYLAPVLHGIGIASGLVEAEIASLGDVAFARTRSRSVLGALNDFAFNAAARLQHPAGPGRLIEAAVELADMPSKPIGQRAPQDVVHELFRVAGRG